MRAFFTTDGISNPRHRVGYPTYGIDISRMWDETSSINPEPTLHTASISYRPRSAPATPRRRIPHPAIIVVLAVIDIAIWVHLVLIVAGF